MRNRGISKIVNGERIYVEHYFRWRSMKSRCYSKASIEYKRYGARGIYVCKEWLNFWTFYKWCEETKEPGKTIDRINNDGPYSPSNCRWATPLEQQQNSRITPARISAMKYASSCRSKNHWTKNRTRDLKGRFKAC